MGLRADVAKRTRKLEAAMSDDMLQLPEGWLEKVLEKRQPAASSTMMSSPHDVVSSTRILASISCSVSKICM